MKPQPQIKNAQEARRHILRATEALTTAEALLRLAWEQIRLADQAAGPGAFGALVQDLDTGRAQNVTLRDLISKAGAATHLAFQVSQSGAQALQDGTTVVAEDADAILPPSGSLGPDRGDPLH